MKVAIAGDHAGFEYKKVILRWLQEQNFETADYGPYTPEAVDYPDTAHQLANSVERFQTFGMYNGFQTRSTWLRFMEAKQAS